MGSRGAELRGIEYAKSSNHAKFCEELQQISFRDASEITEQYYLRYARNFWRTSIRNVTVNSTGGSKGGREEREFREANQLRCATNIVESAKLHGFPSPLLSPPYYIVLRACRTGAVQPALYRANATEIEENGKGDGASPLRVDLSLPVRAV